MKSSRSRASGIEPARPPVDFAALPSGHALSPADRSDLRTGQRPAGAPVQPSAALVRSLPTRSATTASACSTWRIEAVFADKLRLQLAIKNPIFAGLWLAAAGFRPGVSMKRWQLYAQVQRVRARAIRGGPGDAGQPGAVDCCWKGRRARCWTTTGAPTLSAPLRSPWQAAPAPGWGSPRAGLQQVVGVAKAYTTRVGAGPMPTELTDATGETIQKAGQEYGTVTGRARRCGWFDAELVRFTAQVNGVTELALTKLDVLDESGQRSKSAPVTGCRILATGCGITGSWTPTGWRTASRSTSRCQAGSSPLTKSREFRRPAASGAGLCAQGRRADRHAGALRLSRTGARSDYRDRLVRL